MDGPPERWPQLVKRWLPLCQTGGVCGFNPLAPRRSMLRTGPFGLVRRSGPCGWRLERWPPTRLALSVMLSGGP